MQAAALMVPLRSVQRSGNSVNTVAVQCFEDVTLKLGLKYLDNFGFTTLAHGTEADTDANGNVYTDANLPTALGGLPTC